MEVVNKDIVIIEWVDSVRASDWAYVEDVDEKPMDCISVGFLLKETEDSVTIAQNYGLKPEQVCNLMTIPKRSIRSIKEIKENWAPSNEQMSALNEVINYAAKSELQHWNNFIYTLLKSLREQLKKLRGE